MELYKEIMQYIKQLYIDLIDYIKNRKLWNNLTFEEQEYFLEKNIEYMYYLYSDGLYELYMNGDITFDDYVEDLYDGIGFKEFCYLYLDDEKVYL